MGIKVMSHKIRGFNSPHKGNKAFRAYKHMGADILLLQKIHFSETNHPKYFDHSFKQGYFTTFGSRSQEVVIFIRNTVLLDVQHVYKDLASRFLIIQVSLQGNTITIANVQYMLQMIHKPLSLKHFSRSWINISSHI